jgi:hypothetical protein
LPITLSDEAKEAPSIGKQYIYWILQLRLNNSICSTDFAQFNYWMPDLTAVAFYSCIKCQVEVASSSI